MSNEEISAIERRKTLIRELGGIAAELADPRIREQPEYEQLVDRQFAIHRELRALKTYAPPKRRAY